MSVIADRRTNPEDRCAEHHVVLDCGHGLDRGHLSGAVADEPEEVAEPGKLGR